MSPTENSRVTTVSKDKLSIVCPMRNEEQSIDPFLARLVPVLEAIPGLEYELVCVNDGSTDRTLPRLLEAQARNPAIRVVDLSRNFGKEAALTAGIDAARGDAVVPIDVDLQDPPEVIPQLVERWREGFEVVLARRTDRSSDSWLKRFSAGMFYRLHNRIADESIPEDVGDFRLLARPVVEALRLLPERRRFMKGLFAWVGFKALGIPYDPLPRTQGTSSYSRRKLIAFAWTGLTAYTAMPLRAASAVGLLLSMGALAYGVWVVIDKLLYNQDVPGWPTITASIMFFSGIQLLFIGVLGEYLARVFDEVKSRPNYIIARIMRHEQG